MVNLIYVVLRNFWWLEQASHVAQWFKKKKKKNPPAKQETWVQSLGQEGLLEKEIATHSSILAWEILHG